LAKAGAFNWARDYFDPMARGNDRAALRIVRRRHDRSFSFAQLRDNSDRMRALSARSARAAVIGSCSCCRTSCRRGDDPRLHEAGGGHRAGHAGSSRLPISWIASSGGGIRHVVADRDGAPKFDGLPGNWTRFIVGAESPGWTRFETMYEASPSFAQTAQLGRAMRCFSTSPQGRPRSRSSCCTRTRAIPWVTSRRCTDRLREGDVHWTSAHLVGRKHAWSSVFAPWNAGATIFVYDFQRFDARRVLDTMVRAA